MKYVSLNINILDPSSIDKAIEQVRKQEEWLKEKSKELRKQLGEAGQAIAQTYYENAIYAGHNDVEVRTEEADERTTSVIASGTSLLFIEFGTGVYYPDRHPLAGDPELGILERGEYGLGHGKQEAWGYYGDPGNNTFKQIEGPNGTVNITHGNPANQSLYLTGHDLKDIAEDTAGRVFV